MDAEDTGDGGRRLSLIHQFDGTAATAFQFSCGSNRSCHTSLYGRSPGQTSFTHAGVSKASGETILFEALDSGLSLS
jgi:hypothetical protein